MKTIQSLFLTLVFVLIFTFKAAAVLIPSGSDLTLYIYLHPLDDVFELETGTYTSSLNIIRNGITLKRQYLTSEPEILSTLTVTGDNNTFDGLIWDGNNGYLYKALDIRGTGNIVKNCSFLNFAHPTETSTIIFVGFPDGGDNTLIESNEFRMWGRRNVPPDTPIDVWPNSNCIVVGNEDAKNNTHGVIIRQNEFLLGPEKEVGWNSALKICTSTLVENNVFDIGAECLEIKGDDITIRGNSISRFTGYNILANRSGHNNLFENNMVFDCMETRTPTSQTLAIFVWEGGNTVYRNNIIFNCKEIGKIEGKETINHPVLENVLFENNTFVDNERGMRLYEGYGAPQNVVFANNIFYGPEGGDFAIFDTEANYEYTESIGGIYNNLFFNYSELPIGTGHITGDPNFVDMSSNDFRLQSPSPAIDAGIFLSDVNALIDFDGVIRPTDGDQNGINGYDVGAFEYFDPLQTKVYCSGLPNIIFENETIASGDYLNRTLITCRDNSFIGSGSNVQFESILGINLYPGFEVEEGADFSASLISGCTHISGYNNQNYGSNSRVASQDTSEELNLDDDFVSSLENNQLSSNIVVYPNPTRNVITVGLVGVPYKPVRLYIYDTHGGIVLSKKFTNGTVKVFEGIDVSDYGAGIYTIRVETDKGNFYSRFMKR